jgi:hypothetical protein
MSAKREARGDVVRIDRLVLDRLVRGATREDDHDYFEGYDRRCHALSCRLCDAISTALDLLTPPAVPAGLGEVEKP